MQHGLLNLPWWGCVLVTLSLTHITIASVTIFLHRHQAHRALDLNPVVSHFFRFWLWLTTGMVTKEWVAIHRKHHAKCETPNDPHSPQIYGIRKVLFEGAELYRREGKKAETLEKYGHGVPQDWIERNLYAKHAGLGIGLMLVTDVVLFGPLGLSMWAVQMLWIPFFAAGVINGVGHYWGYRDFAPNDASTNIVPWGILIGGEELHNNHHAYVTSAKFSSKWWEVDIGWMYIRILAMLRLATIHRVAPKVCFTPAKSHCDVKTLQAIITHRYDVLAKFAKYMKQTAIAEIRDLRSSARSGVKDTSLLPAVRHALQRDTATLPQKEQTALSRAIESSEVLKTVYLMRYELTILWSESTASKEQLLKQLEAWCQRAENSGIFALQEFSRTLRCYN